MKLKKKEVELLEILPEDDVDSSVEGCHESSDDEKYSRIAEYAYYRAEARDFEPGHALDDWLAAEAEINQM